MFDHTRREDLQPDKTPSASAPLGSAHRAISARLGAWALELSYQSPRRGRGGAARVKPAYSRRSRSAPYDQSTEDTLTAYAVGEHSEARSWAALLPGCAAALWCVLCVLWTLGRVTGATLLAAELVAWAFVACGVALADARTQLRAWKWTRIVLLVLLAMRGGTLWMTQSAAANMPVAPDTPPWLEPLSGMLDAIFGAAPSPPGAAESVWATASGHALLLGLAVIVAQALAALRVGGRFGGRSSRRVLPLTLPLAPAAALLLVLGIHSPASSSLALGVILFVPGALYALSHSRCVRFATMPPEFSAALQNAPACEQTRQHKGPAWGASPTLPRAPRGWAWQALVVSAVWMSALGAGGVLFYWPLGAMVQRLQPPMEQVRARTHDFIGGDGYMSLRRRRNLSNREVLRVTVQRGRASGLWGGRRLVYYGSGDWAEDAMVWPPQTASDFSEQRSDVHGPSFGESSRVRNGRQKRAWPHSRHMPRFRFVSGLLVPLKTLKATQGDVELVEERFEPSEALSALYASGLPLIRDFAQKPEDISGSVTTPYFVRSAYVVPQQNVLQNSVGYEETWMRDSVLLHSELQLPDDSAMESQIKALALLVRNNANEPLDTPKRKVDAVERFLTQRCRYSLDAPLAPAKADPVVYFLVDSQRGACDLFASSAVLLLRAMDVPARLVTGYALANEALVSTSKTQGHTTYSVREKDAHAWVEYYVPEFGWLAFDPTQNTRLDEAPTPFSLQLESLLTLISSNGNANGSILPGPLALWTAMLPLLGLLGVLAHRERRASSQARKADSGLFIERCYARARRRLRRRVDDTTHLSPAEFEARVSRSSLPLDVKQEFAALTHLYIAARYGQSAALHASDEAPVRDCCRRLERALRPKAPWNSSANASPKTPQN